MAQDAPKHWFLSLIHVFLVLCISKSFLIRTENWFADSGSLRKLEVKLQCLIKAPMKRKIFRHDLKIQLLKYTNPNFEMPTIKIVDFTSTQS